MKDDKKQPDEMLTKKIYQRIKRHLLLISLNILLWAGLGALGAWHFMTYYSAEAVVMHREDIQKNLPGNLAINTMSIATAQDSITLPAHLQAIKANLGLNLTPKDIEGMITVLNPHHDSHFIRIIVKSDTAHLAVDIANALAKIAVKSSHEFTKRQLQQELENFTLLLEEDSQKLTLQSKSVADFQKSHQFFETLSDSSSLFGQLMDARTKYEAAVMHYNSLAIEYETLKQENNPLLFAGEIIHLQGKVRAAQKVKQDLATHLDEMEKKFDGYPQKHAAFTKLRDQKKLLEDRVQALTKSAEELKLMINNPQGGLELYQTAEKAFLLHDQWWVALLPILGFFFGLASSLALVYLTTHHRASEITEKI